MTRVTKNKGKDKPTYRVIILSKDGGRVSLSDISRGTGLHLSHVSRVFNRHRTPSLGAARRIAKYLGIGLDQLQSAIGRDDLARTA